jgi:hypothetical protein
MVNGNANLGIIFPSLLLIGIASYVIYKNHNISVDQTSWINLNNQNNENNASNDEPAIADINSSTVPIDTKGGSKKNKKIRKKRTYKKIKT